MLNQKILLISCILALSSCSRIRDLTDEISVNPHGHILNSHMNSKTQKLALANTLGTFIFDAKTSDTISPASAIRNYHHHVEIDGSKFMGNSLQTELVGDFLVTNIVGRVLQVFDVTKDSKLPVWELKATNEILGRFVGVEEEKTVIVHQNKKLTKYDLTTGKIVKFIDAPQRIKQLAVLKEKSGTVLIVGSRTGIARNSVTTLEQLSFLPREHLYQLWVAKGVKGFTNDLLVANYAGFRSTLEVIDTEKFAIVNTIYHLHSFFQLSDFDMIPGTEMAISSSGDRNILMFNLIKSHGFHIPNVIRREHKDNTPWTVDFIPGTSRFVYAYEKSNMGDSFLRIAEACPIKYCDQCVDGDVFTCQQCERGFEWNADDKVCQFPDQEGKKMTQLF